jgi:hypothetical protein
MVACGRIKAGVREMTTSKTGKTEESKGVTRKTNYNVRKQPSFNTIKVRQPEKSKTTNTAPSMARLSKQTALTMKMVEEYRKDHPEHSLEQMAEEHGVKPFDPKEDGKNWPKGASFKRFMDAIHKGRK